MSAIIFKAKTLKANKTYHTVWEVQQKDIILVVLVCVSQTRHSIDRSGEQPCPSNNHYTGCSVPRIYISHFFSFVKYNCRFNSSSAVVRSVTHFYMGFTVFSHFTHLFQDAFVLHIWLPLCFPLLAILIQFNIYTVSGTRENITHRHTTLDLWLPAYSQVLLATLSGIGILTQTSPCSKQLPTIILRVPESPWILLLKRVILLFSDRLC